jgi:hypothetical protein
MKRNSDGSMRPVGSESQTGDGTRELVVRGPTGFRVISETTEEDMIDGLDPGDRIHVVVINDSELGKLVGFITAIKVADLARIDQISAATDDAFHVAIRKAAFSQVCTQMWGGPAPEGTTPEHVFEISKRELLEIMEMETELRVVMARDAS